LSELGSSIPLYALVAPGIDETVVQNVRMAV